MGGHMNEEDGREKEEETLGNFQATGPTTLYLHWSLQEWKVLV